METVVPNCDHRGSLLRMTTCTSCGGRNLPLEVYLCDLHGECSLSNKRRDVRACIGCKDILCVLDPQPLLTRKHVRVKRPKPRPWTGARPPAVVYDPKTCAHPGMAFMFQKSIDRSADPPILTLEIWCKYCNQRFTADGKTVFRLEPQSICAPSSEK